MKPNVELMRKTYDQIVTVEAFAEEGLEQDAVWNQNVWGNRSVLDDGSVCGTAFCYAGWTCVVAGLEIVWNDKFRDEQDAKVLVHGELVEIEQAARDLLGLDMRQADYLFHPLNSLEILDAHIRQYELREQQGQ